MSLLLIVTTSIIIAYIVRLYQKNTNGVCVSQRRLHGKTAIVTGGTSGMGLETAKDLAKRGARVIVACPFIEEGEAAKRDIISTTNNENVIFRLLDLASFESVRTFAADIAETEDRLDILINNAGVGIPDDFLTKDGISSILQINYFGHFLLSLLLLPLLKKSGTPSEPSRIVNMSSIMHYFGYFEAEEIVTPIKNSMLNKIRRYACSKFFFVPFSIQLSEMLKDRNVVINCVDPGAVGTRIFYSAGMLKGLLSSALCNFLFKSTREGAQTAIHVAVDEGAGNVTAGFFKNCKLSKADSSATDNETAVKLWNTSVRLVKITESELKHAFE